MAATKRPKAGRKAARTAKVDVRTAKVDLEGALRRAIEETVSRQLGRLTRGRPLGDELRDLRGALARLEKRLASSGGTSGGRGRRPVRTGSPGRPPLHTGCKVEGCGNEHYALGLCSKHYQQERRSKIERAAARKKKKS